jgi:hypothetical protein
VLVVASILFLCFSGLSCRHSKQQSGRRNQESEERTPQAQQLTVARTNAGEWHYLTRSPPLFSNSNEFSLTKKDAVIRTTSDGLRMDNDRHFFSVVAKAVWLE